MRLPTIASLSLLLLLVTCRQVSDTAPSDTAPSDTNPSDTVDTAARDTAAADTGEPDPEPAETGAPDTGTPADADGDGHAAVEAGGDDCRDDDATRYPGAVSEQQGLSMAYLCPDTFTMGSPATEVARADDEAPHEVTLTRAFYFGVYEVTHRQFESFMGYQPSACSAGCSPCPVENITWYEAAAFANAVSDAAGLELCYTCTGTRKSVECELDEALASPYACEGFRLPTEAEWEYATRAGTSTAFSNGGNLYRGDSDGDGTFDDGECSGDLELDNGEILDDYGVYCGNTTSGTDEVATKIPNPWGLYDVHGNVREWCHDGWDGTAYDGHAEDPWGDESGEYRIFRGGSWHNAGGCLRSANRAGYEPDTDYSYLGMRLARTAP